jgi:hypothetical protein
MVNGNPPLRVTAVICSDEESSEEKQKPCTLAGLL